MKVEVIINPAAGREEAVLFKMNTFFRKHGIEYHVNVTTDKYSATAAATSAVEKDIDAIVGYGGDGTMSEIANVVRGTDKPLLIVPGGTANTLAAELHIPVSITKSLSLLLPDYGRLEKVDMAKVGDVFYLTTLGAGIPARWAKEADRDLKNKYGILAYIFTGVRATIKSKPAVYKLILDGQEVESHGTSCIITNIGASGILGVRMGKDISITDGVLDVLIFKFKAFESMPETTEEVLRSIRKNKTLFFEHYRAKDIELLAHPSQSAMADGELIGDTPLKVTVAPQSLLLYRPTEKALSLWDIIMTTISEEEL